MEFKIEKNVPIPGKTRTSRNALSLLDIGDSFEVSMEDANLIRSLINRCRVTDKTKKFLTRTINKKLRVWRIE